MEKNTLNIFRKWFSNYVKDFYSEDPALMQNIRMKEEHSWRVCSNAIQIARSESLSQEDIYLSQAIALLHDIGRFEQFSKYGTFKDSESEDHASLGVKVLSSGNVLSCIDPDEQEIILFAIENHNKYKISDNFNEKCILHSQIVRDADKLDILKVFIDEFKHRDSDPNPALYMGFPDDPGYSGSIVEDIFNNVLSSMDKVRNQNDLNLTRLTWVYDLHFPESFQLLKKRGYLETIMEILPDNDEMDRVYSHLKAYVDSKAGEK